MVNPFLRLHTKLQRTSKALRRWARGIVGNNKVLLCVTAMLIGVLDVVQEFRQLNDIEIRLRKDLRVRYLGLTAVEKLRAKQALRLVNIRATEVNANFFTYKPMGGEGKILFTAYRRGHECCIVRSTEVQLQAINFSIFRVISVGLSQEITR